jgi:5-methylcytosine-specific restriction endonuclease McrA
MTIQNDNLTVEVYNADYRVLYRVPWQEAVRLILRQAVFIVDPREPAVHVRSPSLPVELPMSVALRAYVHIPYQAGNRVTRVGVLQRDHYTCAYCGGYGNTIEHVIPESRGGENSWFNLVAACAGCNGRKDDRTPVEAGMRLLWEPYEPRERDRYQVPALA